MPRLLAGRPQPAVRLTAVLLLLLLLPLPMPRLLAVRPEPVVRLTVLLLLLLVVLPAVVAVAVVRSGSGRSMLVFVVTLHLPLSWQCADDLTFWYSVRPSYVMLSWLELWPKVPLLACVSVSSAVADLILMDPTMNAKHLHRAASWC
jgi:hypothetical protein